MCVLYAAIKLNRRIINIDDNLSYIRLEVQVKRTGKVVTVHAMQAYRGRRDIAALMFILTTR
jgi:hypothetical protein